MDNKAIIDELTKHFAAGKAKDLASMLNITPQMLSNWKSRDEPNWRLIFTKCVGVSASWLLSGGQGEMMHTIREENPSEKGWEAFCYFLQAQLEESKQRYQQLESIIFHGTPELRNALVNAQSAKRLQALSDKMEEQRKRWEFETSEKEVGK